VLVQEFILDYLAHYQPYKAYWNYEDSCVLTGCRQLYEATGNLEYRRFILAYVDSRIAADGAILNFLTDAYNTDDISLSKLLFFACDETGEERYRKALDFTARRLEKHPRCQCGSFWHKTSYPNQIWLDGLYMVQPFYMEYDTRFGNREHYRDIFLQFANAKTFLYDEEKQLAYHGYDESRVQPWADPITGCSENFWLRSLGWYAMALVDTVSVCDPQIYEVYAGLVKDFKMLIKGILRYQDEASGLWYQVVDHPEAAGNYLETSGSAMIAYSLLKGCAIGILSEDRYLERGKRIIEALIAQKLVKENGGLHLTDICSVAGLGPGDKRDGSIAYYLSEKIVSNDAKGVGPFMMAYAQYLMAEAKLA
jgi:unsaturated rhamnogalacturonyl hydrolase